ncbi:hypothetical protein PAFU01_03340 [Pantoea ananatis]|nr:hypothetical protein PAFU01_03340 [Pantoea ananatis]
MVGCLSGIQLCNSEKVSIASLSGIQLCNSEKVSLARRRAVSVRPMRATDKGPPVAAAP